MQLLYFLVVILSLICGSLPPADTEPLAAVLATLAMVAAWACLCHVGAHLLARQVRCAEASHAAGAYWLDRQLEAFRWLSLGVILLCLCGFGLAPALDKIPMFADSMFLRATVLLTPGLIMVAGTWSAEHHYGVTLNYCPRGIGGYISSIISSFRGGLAWLVVPVLVLLGLIDLIGLLPIGSQAPGIAAILIAVIGVPLMLPRMIQFLFQTTAIDDETRGWIDSVLTAAGTGRIKAVRWETNGLAFNAVVGGFIRPFRILLVSDRLLDQLPREQVAMVLLHEASHLRRCHVPLRMIAVLPAWLVGTLVTKALGDFSWATVAGSVVGIVATMLILRIVAYRTEFDADIQACKLAERIHPHCDGVPGSYYQASETLSDALRRVTADNPQARRATWLHPGVADRVARMRRHRAAPHNNTTSAGTIANPA